MAGPIQTRKQTVDLATPVIRVSRIRRDPPKPVKEITPGEIRERNTRTMVIGVISFTLALFFILIGFSNFAGWSPSQYTIEIR